MIKCPSCHKGYLRQDYGCDIECGECSAVFKMVDGKVQYIPPADPRPTAPILSQQMRRMLFFDRLVMGQSPQEIADELREDGIITVSPPTIQNYKDNHWEEIKQVREGKLPKIRIETPARRCYDD